MMIRKSTAENWPVTCLFGLLLISGCAERSEPVRRETTAMDTFLSVTLYDSGIKEDVAHALIDSVFDEVRRIERMATDYSAESEIGRCNTSAGIETTAVSAEIRDILEASFRYSELSGGAFDISVGPLVHLWDFTADSPSVPGPEEIERLLPLVDFRKILVTDQGVFPAQPGMRIDLGGIAKGYAVDRSIEILRRNGVRKLIVDLGGNLGVYWEGTRLLDSAAATISIRDPRNTGAMIARFDAGTSGIATSGDYQRYFLADGVRYHHVLNPRTGYPAPDVVSVTVVAPDALTADAISTAVFVMGRTKGFELVESLQGVEAIIFFEEGESLTMQVSKGMAGRVVREDLYD